MNIVNTMSAVVTEAARLPRPEVVLEGSWEIPRISRVLGVGLRRILALRIPGSGRLSGWVGERAMG